MTFPKLPFQAELLFNYDPLTLHSSSFCLPTNFVAHFYLFIYLFKPPKYFFLLRHHSYSRRRTDWIIPKQRKGLPNRHTDDANYVSELLCGVSKSQATKKFRLTPSPSSSSLKKYSQQQKKRKLLKQLPE